MPSGDRTGPRGLGSRTGRGLGYCAGYDTPGFAKGTGMGLGRSWGRSGGVGYGRGRGLGYRGPIYTPVYNPYPMDIFPTNTPENQLVMLKQEKEYLESQIDGMNSAITEISKRIEALEKNE